MKKWLLLLFLSSPVLAKPSQLFNACTGCGDFTYAPDSTSIIGAFSGCSGTQYLGADGACHNSGGSSTPSGPNYGVQVDSNGALGASGNFTSDGTSVTMNVPLTVNSNMNINSTNEDIQYIPGPGTGGTSYLWAQGNSSFSPSKFDIVYSALNNGTTVAALLFSNTGNAFQFQDGNGNTNASIGTGGNISATSILSPLATIKTLLSSFTVVGAGGLSVTYGVLSGSATIGQMQVTSNTIISGTTFYQNGPWNVGGSNGTNGQVLTSGGAGVNPSWTTVSGGSGAFANWYLTDSNGVHWSITDSISGHLTSTVVSSLPAGSLAPNQLVTKDAYSNIWTITIDTGGHLITTSAGTTAQSITDLLMNDSNSITWVNTVDTGGHLVTQ